MNRSQQAISHVDLREVVLPRLVGQVFHVTSGDAFDRILTTGAILPNVGGAFRANWGESQLSYFQEQGCISVCDLRTASAAQIDRGLENYYFLDPCHRWNPVVFLILAPEAHRQVLSWADAVLLGGPAIAGVPNIEAGHNGQIPIALITMALAVSVDRGDLPIALSQP